MSHQTQQKPYLAAKLCKCAGLISPSKLETVRRYLCARKSPDAGHQSGWKNGWLPPMGLSAACKTRPIYIYIYIHIYMNAYVYIYTYLSIYIDQVVYTYTYTHIYIPI